MSLSNDVRKLPHNTNFWLYYLLLEKANYLLYMCDRLIHILSVNESLREFLLISSSAFLYFVYLHIGEQEKHSFGMMFQDVGGFFMTKAVST